MIALVTGSTGFLSKYLISKLMEDPKYTKIYGANRRGGLSIETSKTKSDKFVNLYVELSNPAYTEVLLKATKPDMVFNFAASQGKTADTFDNNVAITANLLRYCAEGTYFIQASSSTVMGNLAGEVNGHKCTEEDRAHPTNLYGASKAASENLVQAYTSTGKIKSLILRYVATVGKEANHGVLPDIIKKLKLDDETIDLFGDCPGSKKQYMNIEDVIGATLHLVNNNADGIYNVSPANSITIEEIANFVKARLRIHKESNWLGAAALPLGDNALVSLDNTKLLQSGYALKYKTSLEAISGVLNESEA